MRSLYTNSLKNWEFDKKAAQNFGLERATIAERQGASEDKNFEAKPTLSKTHSSGYLCIKHWVTIFALTSLLCSFIQDARAKEYAVSTGGSGYEEAVSSCCKGPAIAFAAILLAGIITIALQNRGGSGHSSDNDNHCHCD